MESRISVLANYYRFCLLTWSKMKNFDFFIICYFILFQKESFLLVCFRSKFLILEHVASQNQRWFAKTGNHQFKFVIAWRLGILRDWDSEIFGVCPKKNPKFKMFRDRYGTGTRISGIFFSLDRPNLNWLLCQYAE